MGLGGVGPVDDMELIGLFVVDSRSLRSEALLQASGNALDRLEVDGT